MNDQRRPVSRNYSRLTSKKCGSARLLQAIKVSHEESDRTYGSPRVVLDLLDAGLPSSENRVVRLMKAAGIKARHMGM